MHPSANPNSHHRAAGFFALRRRRGWAMMLALLLAISLLGLSVASQAEQVDRWKRGHPAAGQFHATRFGPNARGPGAYGPGRPGPNELSVGSNSRAATIEPEQRRETPNTESRPGDLERPGLNPAE